MSISVVPKILGIEPKMVVWRKVSDIANNCALFSDSMLLCWFETIAAACIQCSKLHTVRRACKANHQGVHGHCT